MYTHIWTFSASCTLLGICTPFFPSEGSLLALKQMQIWGRCERLSQSGAGRAGLRHSWALLPSSASSAELPALTAAGSSAFPQASESTLERLNLRSGYWLLSKGMRWTQRTWVFRFPFWEALYGQYLHWKGLWPAWQMRVWLVFYFTYAAPANPPVAQPDKRVYTGPPPAEISPVGWRKSPPVFCKNEKSVLFAWCLVKKPAFKKFPASNFLEKCSYFICLLRPSCKSISLQSKLNSCKYSATAYETAFFYIC